MTYDEWVESNPEPKPDTYFNREGYEKDWNQWNTRREQAWRERDDVAPMRY